MWSAEVQQPSLMILLAFDDDHISVCLDHILRLHPPQYRMAPVLLDLLYEQFYEEKIQNTFTFEVQRCSSLDREIAIVFTSMCYYRTLQQ